VTAKLPDYAVGSRDSIKLKPRQQQGPPAAAAAAAKSSSTSGAWVLTGDDDGEDELVDDEELLTEEDRQHPAATAAAKQDDCEVRCAAELSRYSRPCWSPAAISFLRYRHAFPHLSTYSGVTPMMCKLSIGIACMAQSMFSLSISKLKGINSTYYVFSL
jgi:hypothetical protein